MLRIFIVLLILCGCQKEKPSQEIRFLLDWLPNPNHVPLYAGIEQGFFQEEGIALKLLKIHDPSESLAFLTSGTADLALYYMPETYVAKQRGAHLVIAGYLVRIPLNAFIFRAGEKIAKPEDLNGKIIGYSVGDFGLDLLHKILERNQIAPKELKNVSFDMIGTLATKRVDILYGAYWNIETAHLNSLGIPADYLPLEAFHYPSHEELIVLAQEGSRSATPAFVAAFKRALQRSIDYAVAHPDEAFAAYRNMNRDKGEMTLAWEQEAWRKTSPILAPHQKDEPQVWDAFSNWISNL